MTVVSRLLSKLGRRNGRRFSRNERGVTAIEFAMVAPVFFLLLGSIMETGIMLFTEYVIQTSVQDAARLVRTGQAQDDQLSASDFKAKICELAGIVVNCSSNVTVLHEFGVEFCCP